MQTKLHIKQAKAAECFELILSDPGSIQDVPKFIKKLGHRIKLIEQSSANVHKYQVQLNEI